MKKQYKKSGYLHSTCKIFYLETSSSKDFEYHYHDFHKILLFLGGSVSYAVEGQEYDLLPGDIIFIPAGQIHRPVIRENIPYERIIAYVSQDYFDSYARNGCDLFACFAQAMQHRSNLFRLPEHACRDLRKISAAIADSFKETTFGTELFQQTKLVEYLILLNRLLLENQTSYHLTGTANTQVLQMIDYINQHITEELSIDVIAQQAYLNRSYVMHLFKAETGYTIGKYITEKRLFLANFYISQGESMTDACYKSGFRNYTTFYQAYKGKYKRSPKQIQMQPTNKRG